MDLGAQAGEVDVPSEGLSPERGHVEDTFFVMFVEIGLNLKGQREIVTRGIRCFLSPCSCGRGKYSLELSRRQGGYCEESSEAHYPVQTTETGRLPSDHVGRSRNGAALPIHWSAAHFPRYLVVLGGTHEVAGCKRHVT